MRSFLSAPAQRPEVSADTLIRRFESETAEILEAPQPIQARATLFVLAGCLAALIAVTVFMRIDRIVTSSSGQIVTTAPTTVLQALDPSIIKSIEVQEGDRVKGGQLLATLDPTFAAADVSALKLQIASLDAQIARAEAELAHQPFSMPESAEPGAAGYAALQKSYFAQRQGQFD